MQNQATSAPTSTSTNGASGEDAGLVRAVLDQVYAAWAKNDADAFVAPYGEQATAILPGTYLRGREAVRATMAEVFAGPLKGSEAVHEVQSIRFVAPGAAVVISRGAVVPAGATEPAAETRTLDTWVLSKQSGAWSVEAFHNCPENPV